MCWPRPLLNPEAESPRRGLARSVLAGIFNLLKQRSERPLSSQSPGLLVLCVPLFQAGKGLSTVAPACRPDDAHEDVVHEVLRLLRAGARGAVAEGVQLGGVSAVQIVQGGALALLQAIHQLFVGKVDHSISGLNCRDDLHIRRAASQSDAALECTFCLCARPFYQCWEA